MVSERSNSRVADHPKLLNPLSPNNNKQNLGINSIKEENGEDSSITFREIPVNIKNEQIKNQNNNSNEEGEHSTSDSSKTKISYSKSNNSTIEVCKVFNKNDNTPIENDEMFKITPHFINEKTINRNINIVLNSHNNKNAKEKKGKFARPLTPNLNIIRKSSAPICQNNANKLLSKINNDNKYLIDECKKYIKNIDNDINSIYKEKESNTEIDNKINNNNGLNRDGIKTENNIKKHSFSCSKNQILKKCNNTYMENFVNEDNIINLNKKKSTKSSASSIYSSTNSSNSKIPFSFNNNRNNHSKRKNKNNSSYFRQEKNQKKDYSIISRRNSGTIINNNNSNRKKNPIRNISRQNKKEVFFSSRLKTFKSENKITVVHSKVNDEINNLFSGLSDNIAKDPEIQNKIESLIKDIKDIQQVVHIKTQSTQSRFRPRKQKSSFNCKKKD